MSHDTAARPLPEGLEALGWTESHAEALRALPAELEPARVAAVLRGRLRLLDERGLRPARLGGRLRHAAGDPTELPAVGDWVAARPGGEALVEHVLPRSSLLVRHAAGLKTEAQPIAANVDLVVVVSSLDADFNPRRLERWLDVIVNSGSSPLLVLSKLDRCEEPAPLLEAAEAAMPGTPIVTLCALDGRGVDSLERWLRPGTTLALVGSSGVGKSTLTNRLLGREVQATGAVRDSDGRGRHVTTHRELFALPGGALLVDTPGMRELGAWADEAGGPAGFDDLEELSARCRFRDCTHRTEPGCAVQEAIEAGELEEARLDNARKLARERARLATRQDAAAQAAQSKRWRALSKACRNRPDKRDLG
jgi:ribosome biogenesis GTPase